MGCLGIVLWTMRNPELESIPGFQYYRFNINGMPAKSCLGKVNAACSYALKRFGSRSQSERF